MCFEFKSCLGRCLYLMLLVYVVGIMRCLLSVIIVSCLAGMEVVKF